MRADPSGVNLAPDVGGDSAYATASSSSMLLSWEPGACESEVEAVLVAEEKRTEREERILGACDH
jgi:hypothetical protein